MQPQPKLLRSGLCQRGLGLGLSRVSRVDKQTNHSRRRHHVVQELDLLCAELTAGKRDEATATAAAISDWRNMGISGVSSRNDVSGPIADSYSGPLHFATWRMEWGQGR